MDMNLDMIRDASSRMEDIGGSRVEVFKSTITNANILTVEIGTTGFCGGDGGHGAKTVFRLKDESSTGLEINASEDKVEIVLSGDTEIETFLDSLKFAVFVIESQIDEKK